MSIETVRIPKRQSIELGMGGQTFRLGCNRVCESIHKCEITPISNSLTHLIGLATLDGQILPVIDLCRLLNLRSVTEAQMSRVIVVECKHGKVGIIVETINRTDTVDSTRLENGASFASDLSLEFVSAIARTEYNPVRHLDIDKLLAV